ncbi:MAG: response regulator [Phycisphaerales bacterium]|nr:response regulator [Phycisphaerales bacterium]
MGTESKSEWAEKKIFTTGEAAVVCKVSQQTIIRCFDKGQLTGFRVPGSRFRRIPREDLIQFMERNGIPTDPLTGGEPERARVLLLHGDDEFTGDVAAALAGVSVDVSTATSAYVAGLMTAELRPDTVVIDGAMPGVDAAAACRAIRASDSARAAQILITGSDIDRDDARALIQAGADEILTKPDAASLVARIRNHRRAAGD